jgi:hypothetical protein
MGEDYEHEFWTSDNKYEDLARVFEEHIEREHPDYVTSDGRGHRLIHRDGWNVTCVNYYTYTGPRVTHL